MAADFDEENAGSGYGDCDVFSGFWQCGDGSAIYGIDINRFTDGCIDVDLMILRIHPDSRIIHIADSCIDSEIGD